MDGMTAAKRALRMPGAGLPLRARRCAVWAAWVAAAAWALAGAAAGQQPVPRFTAGVQVVEVYATVADAGGEPVTGLQASDFAVYEDGVPQEITTFASGDAALTVALGIDRSWSMAGEPLRLAKEASRRFLGELRPSDRSMVVAIGSEAEVLAPLSSDHDQQARIVAALDPWSTTALHDAIIAALDHLDPEPGRQALVVFSDGADRYSRAGPLEVVARARRSRALVYPIAIGRTRPPLMAELAVLTGGRSFQLRDPRALESTLVAIARELRFQYLLGYAPTRPAAPGMAEWRSIRVEVTPRRPGWRVRARDGYTTD